MRRSSRRTSGNGSSTLRGATPGRRLLLAERVRLKPVPLSEADQVRYRQLSMANVWIRFAPAIPPLLLGVTNLVQQKWILGAFWFLCGVGAWIVLNPAHRWWVDDEHLERLYEITPKGLRIRVQFANGRTAWDFLKWRDVAEVLHPAATLVLVDRTGYEHRLPPECFDSEDEKSLLIERATGQQRGALT
jgi:hypothetical protein